MRPLLTILLFLAPLYVLCQNTEELYNKSVEALNKGHVKKALDNLDKILKTDTKHQDALFLRAYIYYNTQKFDLAIKDLDALIVIDSTNQDYLNNRSRTKYALGDINGCIGDISRMILLKPDDATLYFNRGYYKGAARQIEESIKDYDKAIELNPDYKEAYANRGFAKINLLTTKGIISPTKEQTAEACKDLRKAKQLGDLSVDDMLFIYCKE